MIYLRPDPNGAAIRWSTHGEFTSLDMCYTKATLEGGDVIAEGRVIHLLIRSLKYTRSNDNAHALSANCHHCNT